MIIVTFFHAVATVDVLTNRTFCMTIKSSFCFERMNKVDRDFSHWQILSFVNFCLHPEIPRDIALIPSTLKLVISPFPLVVGDRGTRL